SAWLDRRRVRHDELARFPRTRADFAEAGKPVSRRGSRRFGHLRLRGERRGYVLHAGGAPPSVETPGGRPGCREYRGPWLRYPSRGGAPGAERLAARAESRVGRPLLERHPRLVERRIGRNY